MKKITYDVTALIIAQITGSITQAEEILLNKLLQKFPQVRELSDFLNESLPPATIQDPATLEQEARAIIKMAKTRSRSKKIKQLSLVGVAACMITAIILAVKVWDSRIPRQQSMNTTFGDSTDITLQMGNELLYLAGKKLTVHLNKGLLINDTKQLRSLKNGEQALMATLTVPPGKVYSLQLSDGTSVALNSATKIKFPISFKKQERSIDLDGEAFFTVNASAIRPFIVHLPHTDVKALGTQFNVNSYNADRLRVALISGNAKVTSGPTTTVLQPGQVVTRSGSQLEVGPLNKDETSWLQSQIYINDADEMEIIELTWRYFHEKLTIAPRLPNNRITAIIDRREHIDSFLVQLAPLNKIKRDADGIHIKR